MIKKEILFFLLLFLLAPITKACIEVYLDRQEYLPRETLQIEINADVLREITTEDLFLYRGSYLLPQVFFITKISKNKYFAWTNLPAIESEYLLRVRASCREGLKFAQQEFKIKKPIASLYEKLQKENFKNLSVEDHILVALAQSFEKETIAKAEHDFISRNDSCYNRDCPTKYYALSAIAFPLLREKMLDHLIARQNFLVGNFSLEIFSQPQNCTLKISSENVSNGTILNLSERQFVSLFLDPFREKKEIKIELACNNSVEVSLVYSYKNIEKRLKKENTTNFSFTLNNEGCWGPGFRDNCDEESTAYALLTLAYLGREIENKSVEWIKNKQLILCKAVYYLITKDNETGFFLKANEMYSGGWPKFVNGYVTDIPTTAITYFSLEEKSKRAETRMLSMFEEAAQKEKAYILFFIFSKEKIEPIISFWPGMIKTKSEGNFNLILKNEGPYNVTLEISFINSSINSSLKKNSIKTFMIKVPKIITPTGEILTENIEIKTRTDFGGFSTYNIPVLLFTEKGSGNSVGNVNVTEQEINKSLEEIINSTNLTMQNETANITERLLQRKFRFSESIINRTITKKENFTITLKIANSYETEIRDVKIEPTLGLVSILTVEPLYFEKIEKKEQKEIIIRVEPKSPGTYSGSIIAQGKLDSQQISTNVSIFFYVYFNETLTCEEMNGTECSMQDFECKGEEVIAKDTFHCCLGKCEKIKKSNFLPILIIIIALVLLILAYFLVKRKPKKEMSDLIEEVGKKYRERFQPVEESEP